MAPTDDHEADDPPGDRGGRGDRVGSPSRRAFLRRSGLGTAALFGGGFVGGFSTHSINHALASTTTADGGHAHGAGIYDAAAPGGTPAPGGGAGATAVYGHGPQPPMHLSPGALDGLTYPPPRRAPGSVREYEIDVVEGSAEVADGVVVDQWTYGGTAPGPVLRATEGDTLRIRLRNRTGMPHNLHLHGRHSPQMDGWEPIPPGGEFTYEVTAGPAGVHPYHCHTMPLARHLAMGLYGTLIVDPVEPREDALEVVLLLAGWDTDGDGRNDLYAWNGVAGFFDRHPITAPVGQLVRAYVLNLVEYEPLASFHLHAQTFDAFRTGTSPTPHEHTDTVTMSQAERVIVEFRLPERGRYMFHPHQHHMVVAGAMGWFAAV